MFTKSIKKDIFLLQRYINSYEHKGTNDNTIIALVNKQDTLLDGLNDRAYNKVISELPFVENTPFTRNELLRIEYLLQTIVPKERPSPKITYNEIDFKKVSYTPIKKPIQKNMSEPISKPKQEKVIVTKTIQCKPKEEKKELTEAQRKKIAVMATKFWTIKEIERDLGISLSDYKIDLSNYKLDLE